MLPEEQVNSSLGNGEQTQVETTTVAPTTEVQPQGEVRQEPTTPPEVDVNALIAKVRYQEEEIKRQQDYAEFLRGAQQARTSTERKAKPEFDPNGVPIFAEIDEYVEYKLAEAKEREEEERLIQGLEEYGRKAVQDDPNFRERVMLAQEIMQYKPAYLNIFLSERTVEGKVKALEYFAQEHPRYSPAIAKGAKTTTQPATGVDQAIEKLRANSQIPPTLTGAASASPTTKLYSQMTPDEILRELENVKRQA